MNRNRVTKQLGPESKGALIGSFFVANAFIWYLCVYTFLKEAIQKVAPPNESNVVDPLFLLIIGIHFSIVVIFAIIGTLFIDRFKRRLVFIKYWTIAGVLLSMSLALVDPTSVALLGIVGGFLGALFGLGMPVCMGYFASVTRPENRAKLGGLLILLLGLLFPVFSSLGSEQAGSTAITMAIWRFLGLLPILLLKPAEKRIEKEEKLSYRTVVSNKTFLLYLVPWLMFSLINDFSFQINADHFQTLSSELAGIYVTVENILAGAFAVIFGIVGDRTGRKRIVLLGFALLGLGYAALGLLGGIGAAWFYVCVDGIAWGAFSTLFIWTIWGDIAQEKSSEKYYIIGVLPYLLSSFIQLSLGANVAKYVGEIFQTVFSFASFFLFISILPLVNAPETLSDKIMKNLDLSSYVNKARQVEKKYVEKNQTKQSPSAQEDECAKEENENSSEYDEAQKLADKYY